MVKKEIFGNINFADKGEEDVDKLSDLKSELKDLKKMLKTKDSEIESFLEKTKAMQNEIEVNSTKVTEVADLLKVKETELASFKTSVEEKDSILNEYKKKERLTPIQEWYDKQDEETKKIVESSIIDFDDVQYKLFIAGKDAIKEPKKKEEEKPKTRPEDELLNVSNVSKEGEPVIEEEKPKETLKDVYGKHPLIAKILGFNKE